LLFLQLTPCQCNCSGVHDQMHAALLSAAVHNSLTAVLGCAITHEELL